MVAEEMAMVLPALNAAVARIKAVPVVPASPCIFTVVPAESRMRKKVAVPVASALVSLAIVPKVARAAVPVSENPENGVDAHTNSANWVLPARAASALEGLVPE